MADDLKPSSKHVEGQVQLRPLDEDEDDVMKSPVRPAQSRVISQNSGQEVQTIRSDKARRQLEAAVSNNDFLRAVGARTTQTKSYKPDSTQNSGLETDKHAY